MTIALYIAAAVIIHQYRNTRDNSVPAKGPQSHVLQASNSCCAVRCSLFGAASNKAASGGLCVLSITRGGRLNRAAGA